MATFNGARFLQDQLDSIAGQSRIPDQLVVCDDGSVDETWAILEHFRATAPFPVLLHRNVDRRGYAANFSDALCRTTGDLVFLSDQDDVWLSNKVGRMTGEAEANKTAWVFMHDAEIADEQLRRSGLTKRGQIRSAGLADSAFVMGACAAIRREMLDLCLPVPGDCAAHDDWFVTIANELGRTRVVPDVLMLYRRHGASTSRLLVNQTVRATRLQALRVEVREAFVRSVSRLGSSTSVSASRRSFDDIAVEWAESVLKCAPTELRPDIQRWLTKLRQRQATSLARSAARALPLFRRLYAVWRLSKEGAYGGRCGWYSMIRDGWGR
jgi:glycosyltransferase involved in cell wall biosynthesis